MKLLWLTFSDEGEAPVRRSRARRQPSIENDDQSQERPKSGSRTQRLKSGSSEDERPQQRNVSVQ